MEINWLNHACFKIKTDKGKVIYLDPYNIKNEEKADIIITSHEHSDHFSKTDIKKIWKENTILLGPKSIEAKLAQFHGKGLPFYEPYEIDGIAIELVPAYNIKRMRPGTNETFHPQDNKWAGSIIEAEGKVLYHAGDTEHIPEMKKLRDRGIDVAMLPCGGTYTMDFEESCGAALDINPKIVLPMHNWDKDLSEYENLIHEKAPNIRIEILQDKSLVI